MGSAAAEDFRRDDGTVMMSLDETSSPHGEADAASCACQSASESLPWTYIGERNPPLIVTLMLPSAAPAGTVTYSSPPNALLVETSSWSRSVVFVIFGKRIIELFPIRLSEWQPIRSWRPAEVALLGRLTLTISPALA
eukprot:scaffold41481_cov64-Phaeocystis_antarctica.AAC.6